MDTAQYQPIKLALGAFGGLLSVTLIAGAITVNTRTYADTTATDDVTITIASACTFIGDATGTEHTASIIPGTVESNIGTTRMTAVCNDPSGYDIYAVGYSGNEWKNTNLIYNDNTGTTYNIPTGTATSGNTSNWAMKLATGTGDGATIISPYNDYAAVPGGSAQDPGDKTGDYVKVATYPQATTGASGSSLTSTYRVYATSSQVAGTYTGQVKYTLVHPNGAPAPEAKDPSICDTETCMQDLTSSSIATLLPSVGSTATVYDARDEQAYTIAKLADNNYWMTINMKLGKGSGEIITLTSDDTNLPSGTTFDLKASGMAWDSGNAPDATGDCNSGDWFPESNATYINKSHFCINTENPSYGTYYNWYTATAGTGTYEMASGEATGSICPKGWKLPPNSGTGSYNSLVSAAGWTTGSQMMAAPASFLLAGDTGGEDIGDQGVYGVYWSSTADDSDNAYYLDFDTDRINPQYGDSKGGGYSVRCVFGS